jgi:hypothetical protein
VENLPVTHGNTTSQNQFFLQKIFLPYSYGTYLCKKVLRVITDELEVMVYRISDNYMSGIVCIYNEPITCHGGGYCHRSSVMKDDGLPYDNCYVTQ